MVTVLMAIRSNRIMPTRCSAFLSGTVTGWRRGRLSCGFVGLQRLASRIAAIRVNLARTAAVASLCWSSPSANGAAPDISHLKEIQVGYGISTIKHFAPDDRDATILKVWRENFNAHGYMLFVVMLPRSAVRLPRAGALSVVSVEQPDDAPLDVLRDDPHTGEDVVRSIRFARAEIAGVSATLPIIAERLISFGDGKSYVGLSPVEITVYQLDTHGEQCCRTPDMFLPVAVLHPPGGYCHADKALAKALGLALPVDYHGPNTDDGCATGMQ